MLFNLLRPRWESFVVVWREVPLPGGVLQLDSHAGVEEQTEQEVQDRMAGDTEVGPDLRPHQGDLADIYQVEYPPKHIGPVHCKL